MRRWEIVIIAGIIAGILAAIAILYIYIGYISQQLLRRRTGKYYSASTIAEFKSRRIPLTGPKWAQDDQIKQVHQALEEYSQRFDEIQESDFSILSWGTEGKPIGSITAIEGEVFFSHRRDTAAFPAILGDAIYLGDHIQTEKQSRTQILLQDEGLLNLAEDTYIQIEEYIYSPNEGMRSLVIQVLMGRVRGVVGRYFKGAGSRLIISTPTDTKAVEHGSFVVDAASR
jgi:hypothetical protein